jgi:hypothetical protein
MEPTLIIEVPRGGSVERQLAATPPDALAAGRVVVEPGPTDARGNLEAATAGQVVLSLASPEALRTRAGEVRRVLSHAGTGSEPLVVELEAAEELRGAELSAVLEAAEHAKRPVVLRIVRGA